MFRLRPPSQPEIQALLESQLSTDFSYPEVGATRAVAPEKYNVEHVRVEIGKGERVFEAAATAIYHLQHLKLPWVSPYSSELPVQAGTTVVLVSHQFGVYCLDACRIVYLVDDGDGPVRAGFAYGKSWERVRVIWMS